MNNIIETLEYRGFDINIYQDEMAESPRDWDNIGKMVCKHRDYYLGDPIGKIEGNIGRRDRFPKNAEEVVETILAGAVGETKAANIRQAWEYGTGNVKGSFVSRGLYIASKLLPVIMPLYLLDHSGLWMRCGQNGDVGLDKYNIFQVDPGCWDTSLVGWIYCTWKDVKLEYGKGPEALGKAENYLRGEVETYSDYLSGAVYGYEIEPKEGNKVHCDDSCWGFYGYKWNENGLKEMAEGSIDCAIKQYKEDTVKAYREKVLTRNFMKTCWAD